MPVHRVLPDDGLEKAVEDIEAADERIVSTELVGDGCVLVFTERRQQRRAPGGKETRA